MKKERERERERKKLESRGKYILAGLLPVQTSEMVDNTNIGVIMSLLNESIAP